MVEIPKEATRVKVTDEDGKTLWRKPSELKDTDTVIVNPRSGEPEIMTSKPGRKPKVAPPSLPDEPMTIQKIGQARERKRLSENGDKILTTARKDVDSVDLIDKVIIGLAEETASLAFERSEAERKGEPTSSISLRRVNALKAVSDTWLKKKELSSGKSLDLEGKAFQRVFGHIAETFRISCDEAGVRPEMTETIFSIFGKKVDDPDWTNEAKSKIKGDK